MARILIVEDLRLIEEGTAAHLAARLDDPDVVFYGGKTGTIESLGDIVESRAACAAWNRAHTVAGAATKPYWLDCDDRERGDLNDSLFVVGFGVQQQGGAVLPFTLACATSGWAASPPPDRVRRARLRGLHRPGRRLFRSLDVYCRSMAALRTRADVEAWLDAAGREYRVQASTLRLPLHLPDCSTSLEIHWQEGQGVEVFVPLAVTISEAPALARYTASLAG